MLEPADAGEGGQAGLRREGVVDDGGVAGLDARDPIDDRLGHAHAGCRYGQRPGDVLDADDVRLLAPDEPGVGTDTGAEGLDALLDGARVAQDHHEIRVFPAGGGVAGELVDHLHSLDHGDLFAQLHLGGVGRVDEHHVFH